MDLLLTPKNEIQVVSFFIDFGTYENEQKWAIFDENNKILFYIMNDNFHKITYDGTLPEDVNIRNKYIINDDIISINPNWKEPPVPDTIRLEMLEATLDDLLTNVIPEIMGV